MELMYVDNGTIQGVGNPTGGYGGTASLFGLSGDWKIDDSGRMCSSMRFVVSYNVQALPFRCQPWFRYKDRYFLADSDTDRQARVLPRTVKQ